MVELMLSEEFSYWQTGTVENEYKYYFKLPRPDTGIRALFHRHDRFVTSESQFPSQSLINPIQMNQAFMALFSQATAKPAGISTISLSHSVAWPRISTAKKLLSSKMEISETLSVHQ